MENKPPGSDFLEKKMPEFKNCFEYSELIGDSDASLAWSFWEYFSLFPYV